MSGTQFISPRYVPVNGSGTPYPLSKLYFYRAGTTTAQNTYTTQALSTAHANPVVANSSGQFAAIYLNPDSGYDYKVVHKTSADVTLWTEDNIVLDGSQTATTAAETSAGVTPADKSYAPGDSRRYSTLADWALLGGSYELTLVGNYTLTAAVEFPTTSHIRIRGVNAPAITVSAAGVRAFVCHEATSFHLEGVRFIGAGSSNVPGSAYDGLAAISTGLVTVTDSTDVHITKCTFTDFYNGISVYNSDRVWITENHITDWYVYGVVASLCTDFHIDFNEIEGCEQTGAFGAYGISATGDEVSGAASIQKACSISHNVIRDIPSWDGIMTHDCDGLSIIGNDIRNVRAGIDVGHSTADNVVDNILIAGNYIEATTTDSWAGAGAFHVGIFVQGFDTTDRINNVTITGNVVSGFYNLAGSPTVSGNAGHIVVGFANYASITGNVISGGGALPATGNAGIYIPGDCGTVAIAGNAMQGTFSSGGIRFSSAAVPSAAVSGNTITQGTNTHQGVYLTGSTVGLALGSNATNSTVPYLATTSTVTQGVSASGSFTGTLTGCTTSPTGTISWTIHEGIVTLAIPQISATSNTTAATVTGMPAEIRPAAAQSVLGITTNNSTAAMGKLIVETSGVITLHNALSATFTNSGTKAVEACTVSYRL